MNRRQKAGQTSHNPLSRILASFAIPIGVVGDDTTNHLWLENREREREGPVTLDILLYKHTLTQLHISKTHIYRCCNKMITCCTDAPHLLLIRALLLLLLLLLVWTVGGWMDGWRTDPPGRGRSITQGNLLCAKSQRIYIKGYQQLIKLLNGNSTGWKIIQIWGLASSYTKKTSCWEYLTNARRLVQIRSFPLCLFFICVAT